MRFRRRVPNTNGDNDELSESERSITPSASASEHPCNNSFSSVQGHSVDFEPLAKNVALINPILASILLQQLLSSNPLYTSDSASSTHGSGMKTGDEDLKASLRTIISSSFNHPAPTVVNGTSTPFGPLYANQVSSHKHFHHR
jgi:hypothetical protein